MTREHKETYETDDKKQNSKYPMSLKERSYLFISKTIRDKMHYHYFYQKHNLTGSTEEMQIYYSNHNLSSYPNTAKSQMSRIA